MTFLACFGCTVSAVMHPSQANKPTGCSVSNQCVQTQVPTITPPPPRDQFHYHIGSSYDLQTFLLASGAVLVPVWTNRRHLSSKRTNRRHLLSERTNRRHLPSDRTNRRHLSLKRTKRRHLSSKRANRRHLSLERTNRRHLWSERTNRRHPLTERTNRRHLSPERTNRRPPPSGGGPIGGLISFSVTET